ncbi:MAG TPA: DUF1015 domain-containing protein, partial [Acidimicrobiales bacterium]|nr:DUF1015 domain-containing protein [Acidimicrobiales bacterium]
MARIEPFRGIRYDTTAEPLDVLVAPPYDVVDDEGRAELAARSPHNAIVVELPADDPDLGLDRYENAARIFESWLSDGVVARDDVPTLYVHRMSFLDESGTTRHTTGVVCALAVDADGSGDVLPHEQTMPKPKGDRLYLLRSTRANLSPIWGLSLTEGLAKACEAATSGVTPQRAKDEGVVHEVWPISDPGTIAEITRLVGETPVLIADGHHRYETALAFRQECRDANGDQPGDHDLVMALIVELAEEELFVRPIHRLVSGLDGFDFPSELAPFFTVKEGPAAGTDGDDLAAAMASDGALGLVARSGSWLLEPLAATDEAAGVDLDSSRLDVALAALPEHELTYQHGRAESLKALASGSADAVFLLRPATVAQIAETAHGGRRMPPKTTFFHPKPRTGMVFRRVQGPEGVVGEAPAVEQQVAAGKRLTLEDERGAVGVAGVGVLRGGV